MSTPFSIDYTINVGSLAALIAILGVGWRVIAALNTLTFKVDLMWKVFEQRLERRARLAERNHEDH